MRRPKKVDSLLLSFLALQGTLQSAQAGGIMKSSSKSSDASDSSGWQKLADGTYVRVYGNQDAMGASETQGSSGGESSDTEVGVLKVDSGWVEVSNGTWVREQSSGSAGAWLFDRYRHGSRPRSTTSRSLQQSRPSSSALDPSDVVRTRRGSYKASTRPTAHCEDYEELSPRCNRRGTFNCGLCKCSPDFFMQNCECSYDETPFSFNGFNLEDGCRPDNTTTTLCNNRGECICGKCECNPRENDMEVNWTKRSDHSVSHTFCHQS